MDESKLKSVSVKVRRGSLQLKRLQRLEELHYRHLLCQLKKTDGQTGVRGNHVLEHVAKAKLHVEDTARKEMIAMAGLPLQLKISNVIWAFVNK